MPKLFVFFYFKETSSAPRSIFLEPSHPLKYAVKKTSKTPNLRRYDWMSRAEVVYIFSRQPRLISKTIASQWAATSSRRDTGGVGVSGDVGGVR